MTKLNALRDMKKDDLAEMLIEQRAELENLRSQFQAHRMLSQNHISKLEFCKRQIKRLEDIIDQK